MLPGGSRGQLRPPGASRAQASRVADPSVPPAGHNQEVKLREKHPEERQDRGAARRHRAHRRGLRQQRWRRHYGRFDCVRPATTPASGAATTAGGGTTPGSTPARTGGTITLGNEQDFDCADWMGSCGGSSCGFWAMEVQTMPTPYNLVLDGDKWVCKASNLLAGEPTVVTSPKQVVTYKINPAAVWSDGQPITSTDFKYTWDQVVTRQGHLRHDRVQPDRIGRRLRSRHGRRDLQDPVPLLQGSVQPATASSPRTSCRARIATPR